MALFLALVAELYPDTAQLLLSGHADMNALREAINKCQISQFIAKPWDTQELKSVTRQLVEQVTYDRAWATAVPIVH